jgi:hypothetical protein
LRGYADNASTHGGVDMAGRYFSSLLKPKINQFAPLINQASKK